MNILHALHQLLGQGERAANSFQGASGHQMRFSNPQGIAPAPAAHPQAQPSRPIPLHIMGRTEDSGMVQGSQGYVPMNADIAHFQGSQNAQGGQFNPGLTPLQSSYPVLPSVAGQATPQFQGYQGVQSLRHFNPQVHDNGYYWNN